MRLQRVTNRKSGRQVYHKYLVTLPETVVRALGWRPGGELTASTDGKVLSLSYAAPKSRRKDTKEPEASNYEAFRDRIRQVLETHPEGRTWTQIKAELYLPQKVPNNGWVHQMEKDIGLLRLQSSRGTIWRLK